MNRTIDSIKSRIAEELTKGSPEWNRIKTLCDNAKIEEVRAFREISERIITEFLTNEEAK